MEREEGLIGNSHRELPDAFEVNWYIRQDPARKGRWLILEAEISIKGQDGGDSRIEHYFDSGRDEMKLFHRLQERLGIIGTRKSPKEGSGVCVGEVEDYVTPNDLHEA